MINKPKQLKLFRPVDEEDMMAFQNGKDIKKKALELFNSFNFINIDISDSEYLILKFDSNIKQIRDQHTLDEVRIFLRKIVSKVSLWHFKSGLPAKINIPQFDMLIEEITDEKILPNWGHTIYTEKKVPLELFLDICKQNYGFRYANTLLKGSLDLLIPKEYQGLKRIIYFNHKLIPYSDTLNESPYLTTMENQSAKDFIEISKLVGLNGWVLLGNFFDFTGENSLIKDLDLVLNMTSNEVSFNKLYSSDFLFLNNVEFLSERPNSLNIDTGDLICSPKIMNEKKINFENALYFYARMNKTAPFNRNEVVMEKHIYKEYVKLCKIGEEIHKIFNVEQQRGD